MTNRLLSVLIVAAVLVGTVPAPVTAAEDPRFTATVSEPRLTPGAEQVVAVQLENDADEVDDRVKTASNVRVDAVAGDTPFEVISGTQRVGTMPDGMPAAVQIRLAVPASAPDGEYRVPLRVTYEYDGDERETTTVYATVRVPPHPVFEVESVTTNLSVQESGSVAVTLRNNGSAQAGDATLTVQTGSAALAVEGGQSTTRYLGPWESNETRTIAVDVSAGPTARSQPYPLTLSPTYDDANGIRESAPPLEIGVHPTPRQTFAIDDVQVTSFGETTATVSASLTNTGERTVENAVATLSTGDPNVQVTDASASMGTLAPGESAPVTFEIRLAPGASSAPRQFSTVVQYDRGGESTYRSAPTSFRAAISTTTGVLELEPVNNTFAIDDTNRFVVRVTNTGEETVRDLHASLLVQPPYSSDAPRSYVAALEPGESATLSFEVTTAGDAIETTDALPIVVNATTDDGRSVSTGPTLVPVSIDAGESPTSSTTTLVAGVVVVAIVLGGVWWWLNR